MILKMTKDVESCGPGEGPSAWLETEADGYIWANCKIWDIDDTEPYLDSTEWDRLTGDRAIIHWADRESPPPGSQRWFHELTAKITKAEVQLATAGQKEYAREEGNCFGNFDRVAERVKVQCESCDHVQSLSRMHVLLVYLEKHLDGIHSYVSGHRSQREGVEGRIGDARVYLNLLRAMVELERDAE